VSTENVTTELPKSLTFGDRTFFFPWVHLVPRPSAEDEAAIETAIKENGVFPPLCWKDVDGACCVVNGHTRLMIAARLGITEIPEPAWFTGTKEDAEVAAVAENAVTRTWNRDTRLAQVKALYEQKWSKNKIIRSLGIAYSQLQYDLRHLGLIEKPAKPEPEAKPEAPAPEGAKPSPEKAADDVEPAAEPDATPETPADDTPPAPEVKPGETPQPGKAAKPELSPAEKRQKMIDAGKLGIQAVTKALSFLGSYPECDKDVRHIMKVLDDHDNGDR
jgi:ParB-like chromosome segregation protein Spo0J